MRIGEFIEEARERLKDRMDDRELGRTISLLFQELRAYSQGDLILHKGAELSGKEEGWLQNCLERLEREEPLQHILGSTEFHGLELITDHRALIPRPETEEMVERAIASMEKPPERIIDLGTGNGCIALALQQAFPKAEVHAIDISSEALELARENAEKTGSSVHFHQDELHPTSLPGSLTFDLVVSNPPYVAPDEKESLEGRVREYEPSSALFAPREDPLAPYRSIIAFFLERGREGGSLWMELNPEHAVEVLEFMKKNGLKDARIEKDLSGKQRFARARS